MITLIMLIDGVSVMDTIFSCLELLILFFLFRRYRVKKNASWGKVIVIVVITDLLYLVAGFISIYVLVATSLWIRFPQGV